METIEKHIYNLEKELLKTEVRQASEKINEILANDFVEFCSSGDVYHYETGDVFGTDINSHGTNWEIKDFAIKVLSNDVLLGTYKLIKHSEASESKKYSLRSSIWKNLEGTWKMIFHQGTLTTFEGVGINEKKIY